MKLMLVAIALAAVSTPVSATAPRRCDSIVDAAKVRVANRVPNLDTLPVLEIAPNVATTVTCRIARDGRLFSCTSPLTDARGRWLEQQMGARARVIDTRWQGCPLAGRGIQFKIRFESPE